MPLTSAHTIPVLLLFAAFSELCLGEKLTINYAIGFGFIALGAWFVFRAPIRAG